MATTEISRVLTNQMKSGYVMSPEVVNIIMLREQDDGSSQIQAPVDCRASRFTVRPGRKI